MWTQWPFARRTRSCGSETTQQPQSHVGNGYTGRYQNPNGHEFVISLRGDHLRVKFYRQPEIELVPHSKTKFVLRWTAAHVLFDLNNEGRPTGFVFKIGSERHPVKRVD